MLLSDERPYTLAEIIAPLVRIKVMRMGLEGIRRATLLRLIFYCAPTLMAAFITPSAILRAALTGSTSTMMVSEATS